MGTLMADKIAEAFEEWKEKTEEQTRKEQEMKSEPKPEPKAGSLSQQLLAYIYAHPGVTGKELRQIVKERSPGTPISYVPAVLKGLFDTHQVRRETVPNEEGHYGRSTFAYYVLSDEEREAMKEAAKQTVKPKKARGPYKPRKLKAEAIERGITALVPSKRHATHPLDVGATTLSISITVADGTNYSMTLQDAKFLYKQLNQIFGGVR